MTISTQSARPAKAIVLALALAAFVAPTATADDWYRNAPAATLAPESAPIKGDDWYRDLPVSIYPDDRRVRGSAPLVVPADRTVRGGHPTNGGIAPAPEPIVGDDCSARRPPQVWTCSSARCGRLRRSPSGRTRSSAPSRRAHTSTCRRAPCR